MPTPKVSVVVSTYGRAAHLNALLESCRVAFPEDRYAVTAVSSDPITSEKIAWLGKQPNVSVILSGIRMPGEPRKQSLYAFENLGIKAADGEWVFVTNDDTCIAPDFYQELLKVEQGYDVIMVNGHIGDVGLGCRTAVIGTITPPHGLTRDLYLYDFTIIRKSVYERIGFLDERLDWFGKGFDLAMACEVTPGLRILYKSGLNVSHSIAAEGRTPPGHVPDFSYATNKWNAWCAANGWAYTWPW